MPDIVRIVAFLWLVQAVYGPVKAWLAWLLLDRQRKQFSTVNPQQIRPAVLIVAAKGTGVDFTGFLDLVMHQRYPDYRILFVTQSAEDPAALSARSFLKLGPEDDTWKSLKPKGEEVREVHFIVSGLSDSEGQKVHNQRAAFTFLRESDRLVAFADADIVGSRTWLGELLVPLNQGVADLSSGYRWLIPKRNSAANWIGSNINGDIAMLAGPVWQTLLWGGSMALTREAFEELAVPQLLKGSLNDDLQLTRAAKEAGKRLIFVRSLIAPSPVDYDWAGLFEFARRQYFQVRIYTPLYWWLALAFTTLWLGGVAIAWWGALHGDGWSVGVIIGASCCVVANQALRRCYLKRLFDGEVLQHLHGPLAIGWFTTTVNFLIHWWMVAGSAFQREVTWAGIRYRVKGRQKVEVLARHP